MKNFFQMFTRIIPAVMLAISFSFMPTAGYGASVKTVAICPFQMNAAEDLSFLQKGLFAMLSSRLADPGKVAVIDRETIDKALLAAQDSVETQGPLTEAKARQIGKNMGVDYVLFGSLTLFGSSVSLDTTMVDVSGEKPVLTFSRQADQPGAVITEMDTIATQINLKTFDRRPEQFIPVQPVVQQRGYQGDSYASPLINYRVLMATSGEIISMSCADVDGDGKNEVVAAYTHGIQILKDNANGQLVPMQTLDGNVSMDIVGADAADLNRNKKAEIFVTQVHRESGYLKSYVLEYDGAAYQTIARDLPWYMRAVTPADSSQPTVFAQKSGKMGPYKGENVFVVDWMNGSYAAGKPVRVPKGFTVMSMTRKADIGNSTGVRLFTDEDGRLVLFNEAGTVEWTGDEGYGGGKLYYEYKETDYNLRDIAEGRGAFFQPRSLVLDTAEGSGKQVLVIKNQDAADVFSQLRRFKSGEIEILRWSEMGLSPEHAPKKIPGQITDIAIGDTDNNGKTEVMVAFIKQANNFNPRQSKSMIIAYDLKEGQ